MITKQGVYYTMVQAFKKSLLEGALLEHGGNRTYTARDLGLPRTYLIKLINELGVNVPSRWREK